MKKIILILSSILGMGLIGLFIFTIYNINYNLSSDFGESNHSIEAKSVNTKDICNKDNNNFNKSICNKDGNKTIESNKKQISINNKIETINKKEDKKEDKKVNKINLKKNIIINNNEEFFEKENIILTDKSKESNVKENIQDNKIINQENKNQENKNQEKTKQISKEKYIISNQDFLKIVTKLEKIENGGVILPQNSLLNIEYWNKNILPKENKENKIKDNINKDNINKENKDSKESINKESKDSKESINKENKENKEKDYKALLKIKKSNPNLIPKKNYGYSDFIDSQYYTTENVASDERYGFYLLPKDKPEILIALKKGLTIKRDGKTLDAGYKTSGNTKNNTSSFSIYEIISKDLTNKNLDYLIKEDKLLLQAEKGLSNNLKLDRYTKIKDNRTVFIEEFTEGNYRCMYWSDRLNDKYIVMYSGCGLKSVYTLDSRLFFSDFYLKNKLKSLDRDRLNDIKYNKFPYFYSFENSIRQYDEDGENIIANIINKDNEIITTFSNKKLNCSQALDLPVLLCIWEYPGAKLEGYKLLFLNTNKYVSLENNEKEDYVGCYFDDNKSIRFTEDKKEIMIDCYFDGRIVKNQFFNLNGKLLRDQKIK